MPTAQKPKDDQTSKSKPVHEFRLGSIKASIWANTNADGILRYNTTFSRSYKVAEEWRTAESFGRDDLPRVMKCADLAFEWIFAQAPAENTEGRA